MNLTGVTVTPPDRPGAQSPRLGSQSGWIYFPDGTAKHYDNGIVRHVAEAVALVTGYSAASVRNELEMVPLGNGVYDAVFKSKLAVKVRPGRPRIRKPVRNPRPR